MMPDNAARIWVEGTWVHLSLPGPVSTITPHYIQVPNDRMGWDKIKDTLEHRTPSSSIGTKGDPYQAQAEKSMKDQADEYLARGGNVTRKRTFTGDEIASALAVMRECGVL